LTVKTVANVHLFLLKTLFKTFFWACRTVLLSLPLTEQQVYKN